MVCKYQSVGSRPIVSMCEKGTSKYIGVGGIDDNDIGSRGFLYTIGAYKPKLRYGA